MLWMHPNRTLTALLTRQTNVISRPQALAHDMTDEAWRWRISSGVWQSPIRGIAIAHSGPLTDEQLVWVCLLHAGTGAQLSGHAALVQAGFRPKKLSVIDVVVPWKRQVKAPVVRRDGKRIEIALHRMAKPEQWAAKSSGLQFLSPQMAVLHAAGWAASDKDAEWRLAAVVQQRLTTVTLIRTALRTLPNLKRRALIGRVLDDVELGAHAASELAFLRFCREHGLPLPDQMQVRVRVTGTRYLDVRYGAQRLTIEIDGMHHLEVRTWNADTLRTLELVAAQPGERLVRLTAGNLRHDGPIVARNLRLLLGV